MTLPRLPVRDAGCPPAADLEYLAAGDGTPETKTHVDGCATCTAELARLRTENEAFLKARPPQRFLTQLDARARTQRGARAWFVPSLVALAAAAVLLVVLRPTEAPPVTFKGSFLSVSVKRGDEVRTVTAGEVLREGDALRFSVRTERPGFAVVLERDGAGKVTVVAPFDAKEPQRVPAGTTVLEDSAQLDASPGPETFVAVLSERPFVPAALVRLLEAGRAVSCEACVVEVSTFDKR